MRYKEDSPEMPNISFKKGIIDGKNDFGNINIINVSSVSKNENRHLYNKTLFAQIMKYYVFHDFHYKMSINSICNHYNILQMVHNEYHI